MQHLAKLCYRSEFSGRSLLRSALLCLTLVGGATTAMAQTSSLERGRYLVTTIMACGNCHTPKDADGRPVAGKELAGGGVAFDIPPFAGTAANITPDRETGIGSWSDDEIKRAITHGARPDRGPLAGKALGAPMAVNFYKAITASDLDAVVAYLRQVPAVRNALPPPVYRMPVRHEIFPEAERGYTERDMQDKARRGAYLATIGHCLECHTPMNQGVTQYETALGAGARPFMPSFVKGLPESWKGVVSRNVTSHPEQGLGNWSDAEIKRAITQGIARDGRRLQPPMAFGWYAGIRNEDLDAIVAYLRTLPPLPR